MTCTASEWSRREADAIRDAAARIVRGESFRSVMLSWNDRGLKTPRGGEWRNDTFTTLMGQPRLAGLRAYRGEVVGPATWPAIIDVETHQRIAAIIESRKRGPKTRPARKHLLTGYVRCHCGARLTVAPNTEGVTRYVCPPRGNGKGSACVSIVAHRADAAATDHVLAYLDSREFARALARNRRIAADAGKSIDKLTAQLNRDRARLVELGDMLADGEVDRPEYKRLSGRVQDRIAEAERKMDQIDTTGPSTRLEGQGAQLRRAWDVMTLEERRDVIGAVVDHFVVDPAGFPPNVFRPERVRPVWRF